jgi:Ca2+-dependent lipid-binding protein
MNTLGSITIRPLAANLTHDVDLFGKQDAYCLVTFGTQQWKSQICKSGGKTPTWNDEVTFSVQPGVDIIRIALYDDKLIGSDKLIAEGVIPVEKLFNFSSPFDEKIPLTFKAKPCGFLQLRIISDRGSMMGQD